MGFAPATRVFAGTPGARFRDSCTYTATDSSQPAAMVSVAVEVEVTGGPAPLSLRQVFENGPDNRLPLEIGKRIEVKFAEASDGVQPYTYEVLDCTLPAGLEFHSSTRVLSGTPDAEYRGPNCTYPGDGQFVSAGVRLPVVRPWSSNLSNGDRLALQDAGRFEPGGPCVIPGDDETTMPMGTGPIDVAALPAAHAGEDNASYAILPRAQAGTQHPHLCSDRCA